MYVYISTDSVYDVCDVKLRRDDYIKEFYAVRPLKEKMIKDMIE